MARFPDAPAPQGNNSTPYPFKLQRPLVRGGMVFSQRTRALTRGDVFSSDLTYVALSWAQVMTLYAFWNSVGGGNGLFSFADFNGFEYGNATGPGVLWDSLYVGKGDGTSATQPWTLPTYILQCHEAAGLIDNVTVVVGGTTKPNISLYPTTSGSDGYIRKGYGTDGFDYLHLAAAPAADALIYVSGTCRRGIRTARFMTDEFPFRLMNPANYQGGTLSIMEQVT